MKCTQALHSHRRRGQKEREEKSERSGEGSRDIRVAFVMLAVEEINKYVRVPKKIRRSKEENSPPPFLKQSPASSGSSLTCTLTPRPSSSPCADVAEGPPFLCGGGRIRYGIVSVSK
jgi:hypothetical protein